MMRRDLIPTTEDISAKRVDFRKPRKGLDGPFSSAETYDELERSFEQAWKELERKEDLLPLKELYERVLLAVRRSHDTSTRLAAKCKQVNDELLAADSRATAALKLSEEDQTTIAALRKELEKTWRQISASHDKETKLRSELSKLQLELEEATRQMEENREHDAAVDVLLKQKQDLIQEQETQSSEIRSMRQEAEQMREQLKQKDQQREAAEADLASVRAEAASRRAEQERDNKMREKLEKEIRELKMSMDARQVEIRNKAAEVQSAENILKDYEQQIREQNVASNRTNKEYNELVNQGNRLQRELDAQTAACGQLAADNQAFASSLKAAQNALAAAKAENLRLARTNETNAVKFRANEEKRIAQENTTSELRAQVRVLEQERDTGRRELAVLDSKVASVQHEREVLTKLKLQAEGSTHEKMDLVKVHEGHIKVLEGELAAHRNAAQHAAQQEALMTREHESLMLQAKMLNQKLELAQQEAQQKDKEAAGIRAQMEEMEGSLQAQNKAYDQVRSERNRSSRDIIKVQAEVADAKRIISQMAHQVSILRAELRSKDTALMKEKFAHSRAETEQHALTSELQGLEKTMTGSKHEASVKQEELRRMQSILALAEQERTRQRKEYEDLMANRDILGTQLVRRNDEVALLHAKLRLQNSSMQAGEAALKNRLAELRMVKSRVSALKRDLFAARKQSRAAADSKRELQILNKRLLYEQAKSKALSLELETPLNVHRWRKLEGSDPASYELIQKVQLLQRQLIHASEHLVERDLQIKDKEKLCRHLQTLLKRSPGPDAAKKLSLSKADLRMKVKKLHAIRGELDMRHAQCDKHKFSIKKMQVKIEALQGHYYVQKRLCTLNGFQTQNSDATIEEASEAKLTSAVPAQPTSLVSARA